MLTAQHDGIVVTTAVGSKHFTDFNGIIDQEVVNNLVKINLHIFNEKVGVRIHGLRRTC